ncbi:hypothetical protein KIL84_018370 [Mauremys mutica]|uniref:Ig-like domain-containing protein n=1 Tax=Mauremys mutica TaxID=74926 RepID=A0A9D3XT05_9SAUR|nr:hypothetical protein KIL84_018370 [Mauremys mutica]
MSRYPMVPHLLFIVGLSPLGWAVRQPPDMVVSQGQLLTLNCSQISTSFTYMYWYKQAVGKDVRLQLVVFSIEGSGENIEKPFEGHFQSSRTKNHVLSLSTESAQVQDSGTYYCAKQDHTVTQLPKVLSINLQEKQVFFFSSLSLSYHFLSHMSLLTGWPVAGSSGSGSGCVGLCSCLRQIPSQMISYPMVPHLLFIVGLSPLGWAVRQPPDMVVSQGQLLTLNCSQISTSYTNMYWYKQDVGKDARLQLVVFSTEDFGANVEKPFEGVGSAYVEQLPFLTGRQGHSLALQCTLKQSNCDRMFWYRQRGGRELEGLFYSYGDQLVNFTAELLTAQRSNKNWDLKWNKLSQSDSAVYYCACSTAQ